MKVTNQKKWTFCWTHLLHTHLQVHLQEQQEEELITVDAIGCFEEEEEEPEEVPVAQEEEARDRGNGKKPLKVPKIKLLKSCQPFL